MMFFGMTLMPDFSTPAIILLLVALVAYLLGSIPFGLVISRLFGLPDPRTVGSNNIGATNVLRSGSKLAALLTVLLDGLKGTVAVVLGRVLGGEDAAQIAALAALLGHCHPVWLGFRGGKGVATLFGVLVGLAPFLGLVALVGWLFTFFVFRISSLAALASSLATPLVALMSGYDETALLLFVLAAYVWWRHRANIARLMDGTEPMTRWSKR